MRNPIRIRFPRTRGDRPKRQYVVSRSARLVAAVVLALIAVALTGAQWWLG